jgi:hypothetical protein
MALHIRGSKQRKLPLREVIDSGVAETTWSHTKPSQSKKQYVSDSIIPFAVESIIHAGIAGAKDEGCSGVMMKSRVKHKKGLSNNPRII